MWQKEEGCMHLAAGWRQMPKFENGKDSNGESATKLKQIKTKKRLSEGVSFYLDACSFVYKWNPSEQRSAGRRKVRA